MFGKTVSKSKRYAVYPRTDLKAPAYSDYSYSSFKPEAYTLQGDPHYAESYRNARGESLADRVQASSYGPSKMKAEIRTRRFRNVETMCNALSRDFFEAVPVIDGVLVHASAHKAEEYNAWKRGEVFGIALTDDPDDDTGSTVYVGGEDAVPGSIIAVATKPIVGIPEAKRLGRVMAERVSPKTKWRFSVRTLHDIEGLSAEEAAGFGYDGSDMSVGESRVFGDYVITRMHDDDGSVSRGGDGYYDVMKSGKPRRW